MDDVHKAIKLIMDRSLQFSNLANREIEAGIEYEKGDGITNGNFLHSESKNLMEIALRILSMLPSIDGSLLDRYKKYFDDWQLKNTLSQWAEKLSSWRKDIKFIEFLAAKKKSESRMNPGMIDCTATGTLIKIAFPEADETNRSHDEDLPDDLAWIRRLAPEIWDSGSHPYAQPPMRRLTDMEFDRVFGLVVKHGLPCTIHNLNTSVGMSIYERPFVLDRYPGIEPKDMALPVLIFIPAKALPLSFAEKADDRVSFDEAWDVFSQLTHTESNAKLLASCGFPQQKSKGYYSY